MDVTSQKERGSEQPAVDNNEPADFAQTDENTNSKCTVVEGEVDRSLPIAEVYNAPSFYREQQMRREEVLIFLLDVGAENGMRWEPAGTDERTRLDLVKEMIAMMVRRKSTLSGGCRRQHSFLLATYSSSDDLDIVLERTSDPDVVIESLASIRIRTPKEKSIEAGMQLVSCEDEVETGEKREDNEGIAPVERGKRSAETSSIVESESIVDLSILFNDLRAVLEVRERDAWWGKGELLRCIFFYGRSRMIPTISLDTTLAERKDFYLDVLYIHLKNSDEGTVCQEVFDVLCQLRDMMMADSGKYCFVLETMHSRPKLVSHCALLAGHAAQREDQEALMSRIDFTESKIKDLRDLCLC